MVLAHKEFTWVTTPTLITMKSWTKNQQLFLHPAEDWGQVNHCPPKYRDRWVQRTTVMSRRPRAENSTGIGIGERKQTNRTVRGSVRTHSRVKNTRGPSPSETPTLLWVWPPEAQPDDCNEGQRKAHSCFQKVEGENTDSEIIPEHSVHTEACPKRNYFTRAWVTKVLPKPKWPEGK